MASVNTSVEVRTEMVEVAVEEKTYTITLNQDEADSLRTVLGRIGGSPKGRRGHCSAIWNGLMSQGARLREEDLISVQENGFIYFKKDITSID